MPVKIIKNPLAGRIHDMKVRHGQTGVLEYFIMPFTNDYTPTDATVGNTAFLTACGEITQYTGERKKFWADAIVGTSNGINEALPATFVFTEKVYLQGYAVITTETKGSEGIVISCVNYNETMPVEAGSHTIIHDFNLTDGS